MMPKSASARLMSLGKVMAEGAINSLPFRAALEPYGDGCHRLKIGRAMRSALGIDLSDAVIVEITRIDDESETRIPSDLRRALTKDPSALASWRSITPMARRDWIFSICTAKQAETRERRIAKAVDMLAGGKRRLCCFPGIKWMMKENAKVCGMWKRMPDKKID